MKSNESSNECDSVTDPELSPDVCSNVFLSVSGVDAPGTAGPSLRVRGTRLLPPGPACSSNGLPLALRLLTS